MAIIISQDQTKATSGYFIPASATNSQEIINKAIVDSPDGIVTIDDDKYSIYKINAAVKIQRIGVTLQATSPDNVLIQPINGAVCNSSDIKSNGNITVYGTSNVKILNLTFNHPTCNGKTDGSAEGVGKGNLNEQRACVRVQNSFNVEVANCKVKFPIYMDFCYVSGSSNVKVHDNYADKTGHALVQFDSGTHDCEAYNNWHKVFCNAGIRSYGGKNIKIYNNTILGGYGSGQALIELRGTISNITITKNILYACHFSVQNFVIQCDGGASPSQVHCSDNAWWDAPGGFGQVPSTGNIQALSTQQDAAFWLAKGYGPQGSVNPKPVAKIGVDITTGYAPLLVKFTDLSVNEVTRLWEFGDGGTLTDAVVSHTFSSAGSYVTKLTATNAEGSNSTTTLTTVIKQSGANSILVSFDGTGQFNCTGTHDNPIDAPVLELAMRAAKAAGFSQIVLNGPHTYYIDRFPDVSDRISITGKKGAQVVFNAVL